MREFQINDAFHDAKCAHRTNCNGKTHKRKVKGKQTKHTKRQIVFQFEDEEKSEKKTRTDSTITCNQRIASLIVITQCAHSFCSFLSTLPRFVRRFEVVISRMFGVEIRMMVFKPKKINNLDVCIERTEKNFNVESFGNFFIVVLNDFKTIANLSRDESIGVYCEWRVECPRKMDFKLKLNVQVFKSKLMVNFKWSHWKTVAFTERILADWGHF